MPVPPDQEGGGNPRILEQLDILEGAGDPELGDAEGGFLRDVLILEINPARGRAVDPRDQVEDRAFSRPVGADDRKYLARLHREADGIDRLEAPKMQREIFGAEIAHRLRSDFT